MADDDGDDQYADDQYADDQYYGEEEEEFEDYVPTTVDPGWTLFLVVVIFSILLFVVVAVMLWRTRKKRKVRETVKGAAIIANARQEKNDEDDDDGSESSSSSDDSSIITEIEDDSVTSATVPIIDTMFTCDGEGEKKTVAFLRGRGQQVKRFFRSEDMASEFVHHPEGEPGVLLVDTSNAIELSKTRSLLSAAPPTEVMASDYSRMETDAPIKQENPVASDYHQMEDDLAPPTVEQHEKPKDLAPPKVEQHEKPRTKRKKRSSVVSLLRKPSKAPPEVVTISSSTPSPPPSPKDVPAEAKSVAVYSQVSDEVEAVHGMKGLASLLPFVSRTFTAESKRDATEGDENLDGSWDLVGDDEAEGQTEDDNGNQRVPPKESNVKYVYVDKAPDLRFVRSICRKMGRVAEYDNETKKILKLAIPYSMTAIFGFLSNIILIAVIGNLLGTRELSAFLAVHFASGLTAMLIEGPLDILSIVCSQAIGAGEGTLAGEYLQIAVVITQILFIPQMILWIYFIEDLILWLGFDEETALIGYDYAIVVFFNKLFSIMEDGLVYFLEVCEHEEFAAIVSIAGDVCSLSIILSVALKAHISLQTIAIIHFGCDIVFFLIALAVVLKKGWFKDYWPGITGKFALANIGAVKQLLRSAIPLSIAHVLEGGEWEILFVAASLLGPAEVVAWGLFGELWEGIETVSSALSDAAEVRCAYLIGADKPMRAKHSAQKSLLMGLVEGLVLAGILAVTCPFLPGWLTSDPTVQDMLQELIPFMCVAVIITTVGTISFALVGAQGRLKIATTVLFVGSWLFTLPIAFLSAAVFNLNLEGLAAAVVFGNALSGMINLFLVLSTDWYEQAAITRKRNKRMTQSGDGLVICGMGCA